MTKQKIREITDRLKGNHIYIVEVLGGKASRHASFNLWRYWDGKRSYLGFALIHSGHDRDKALKDMRETGRAMAYSLGETFDEEPRCATSTP